MGHIFSQGPMLATLARTAFHAAAQARGGGSGRTPVVPGPEVAGTVDPRPAALISDYVRHVGGDASAWRGRVPPHFFPQWAFPFAARTLDGVPYPIAKVMNGGCRVEVRGDVPAGEPLVVRARLDDVDDDGRRAVLRQRIVTGTKSAPEALAIDLYAIVPLPRKKGEGGGARERARVDPDAREIAFGRVGPRAGLEFADLTGDYNPIHWVPAYARAMGFKSTILHGFSTMARAWEALARVGFAGDTRAIEVFDARFTRPLVLPAEVGVYVLGDRVWVGDAKGGPAYLEGTFVARGAARQGTR